MRTSMPRALAAATSVTLVVPVSTVTMTRAPACAAASPAASESPWPSSRHDGPQGDGQDGEAGDPVRIEVTEHQHGLAGVPGALDAGQEDIGIRQQGRIMQ